MGLENVSSDAVADAGRNIETQLSRGLDVRDVQAVPAEEVEARTGARGISSELGDYEVCFRVKIAADDDVLETRGEVDGHIRDQLLSMETRGVNGPDTLLISSDHPPEHLENKSLVFYMRAVL